jgi:hypothetical protein
MTKSKSKREKVAQDIATHMHEFCTPFIGEDNLRYVKVHHPKLKYKPTMVSVLAPISAEERAKYKPLHEIVILVYMEFSLDIGIENSVFKRAEEIYLAQANFVRN